MMDFSKLQKHLRTYSKNDNIVNFDFCVFYNNFNVYSYKKSNRPFAKNSYNIDSVAKIICCVALMKQIQEKRLSLYDDLSIYLPISNQNISIREFLNSFLFADSKDEIYNYTNIKKIIETCSANERYDEYILQNIVKPLKMKSVSFFSDDDTFIAATVNDYARFCDTIFNSGERKNRHKILSDESVNILINDIILKNKTDKKTIKLEANNEYIIIDTSKKITIIFAQCTQNISSEQFKEYAKIYELAYDGAGINTFSKGINLFP